MHTLSVRFARSLSLRRPGTIAPSLHSYGIQLECQRPPPTRSMVAFAFLEELYDLQRRWTCAATSRTKRAGDAIRDDCCRLLMRPLARFAAPLAGASLELSRRPRPPRLKPNSRAAVTCRCARAAMMRLHSRPRRGPPETHSSARPYRRIFLNSVDRCTQRSLAAADRFQPVYFSARIMAACSACSRVITAG